MRVNENLKILKKKIFSRISKSDYPFGYAFISDHPVRASEIIKELRPHSGAFIGICRLEGSFLCENQEEVFNFLQIGERAHIAPDPSSRLSVPSFFVIHENGTRLGKLPRSSSVLPNMLISRGLPVYCHIEAKTLSGGMLGIAVSVYTEDY